MCELVGNVGRRKNALLTRPIVIRVRAKHREWQIGGY